MLQNLLVCMAVASAEERFLCTPGHQFCSHGGATQPTVTLCSNTSILCLPSVVTHSLTHTFTHCLPTHWLLPPLTSSSTRPARGLCVRSRLSSSSVSMVSTASAKVSAAPWLRLLNDSISDSMANCTTPLKVTDVWCPVRTSDVHNQFVNVHPSGEALSATQPNKYRGH